MDIVVKVAEEAVTALALAAADGTPISAVLGLPLPTSITLVPMHPAARDAEARSWFVAEGVPASEDVLASLRSSPMVEAAYVKPGAEPPL